MSQANPFGQFNVLNQPGGGYRPFNPGFAPAPAGGYQPFAAGFGPQQPAPGGGGFGIPAAAGGPVGIAASGILGGINEWERAAAEGRQLENQRRLMEAQRQQGFNEFQLRDLPQLARSEQANTLRSALFSGGLTSILGSGGFRGGGRAFGGGTGPTLGAWEAPQPGGSMFGGLATVASDYWRPRPTAQLSRMSGFEVETPEFEAPSQAGAFFRGLGRGIIGAFT